MSPTGGEKPESLHRVATETLPDELPEGSGPEDAPRGAQARLPASFRPPLHDGPVKGPSLQTAPTTETAVPMESNRAVSA
ncbi:MAG: hypothetical protein Q4G36_01695 [Paracoccus sp. (in: a-proteobacteria)]|nr:hypothetical protein [Paracoccus sp. (in: a-proteobacteria)]